VGEVNKKILIRKKIKYIGKIQNIVYTEQLILMIEETIQPKITIKDYYKDTNILVTGHTGFKGSWLSIWLDKMGANVIGLSLKPHTKPSLFEISNLENKVHNHFIDIKNLSELRRIFNEYRIDVIFHLAAQTIVRDSYLFPRKTYETNVMGLVNLFEAAREHNSIKAIINVTSDKCYDNKEWVWGYRENDPMGGYDPYSSSKGCAELITSAYRNSFFKNKGILVASVRAGNVIGGGDWAKDRIIPDCIRSIIENKSIIIRNPTAVRPWQHVLEALSGYIILGTKLIEKNIFFASGWNFGPKQEDILTVEELVEKAIKIFGEGSIVISKDKKNKLHEANFLKLDIGKALFYLNWKPILSLNEAIEDTIQWYKDFYRKNKDPYKLCIKQIESYEEKFNTRNKFYQF